MFDEVTITRDVVFREVIDAAGNAVQLTADIYEPVGDTEGTRPAVVWLDGGWFGPGEPGGSGDDMAAYAEAFAKRGYVAVTMQYRDRPGLACCPTRDALGVTAALVDAHDDATHGVMWLEEHAAEYGIDPEAIAAGGAQAGAVAAYGLAYRPGESHHDGAADVAAALPIAGMSLGKPTHEGAPVLAFNGSSDLLAPRHFSQWTCDAADTAGVRCDSVAYAGGGNDIAETRQCDIVNRSAEFLAETVLEPAGYIDPTDPTDPTDPADPTGPTDPTHPTHPNHPTDPTDPPGGPGHGGTPGQPISGQPGDPGTGNGPGTGGGSGTGTGTGTGTASGKLAKTGSDTAPLVRAGLGLALAGAVLIVAAGWRRKRGLAVVPVSVGSARARRPGDEGGARLPAVAVVATVGLVLGLLAAPGYTLARQASDPEADTTDTTVADQPDTSSSTTVVVDPGGGVTVTPTTEPMGHDHETPDTTVVGPPEATTTSSPTTSTTMGDDDPEHDPEHDPDHPPTDPDDDYGFPEEWTPDQVAYATQLIHDTEAALPRFANPAILPLLGYTWIFDGVTDDTYQHWINTSLIVESETMNPEAPESLVFRKTPDGPVLEAAMFMLPVGYTLSTIPADIAWLPDRHVHENLCFDGNFRIVGLTVDGVCEVGFNYVTPPMVHVWTVGTPCGRFAGVDENGLQCHHEH